MANEVLITLGAFCILAAIVGGGVKAFSFELQIVSSLPRQILLGILGVGLIGVAMYGEEYNSPSEPPLISPETDDQKPAPQLDVFPSPQRQDTPKNADFPPNKKIDEAQALNLSGYICAIQSYGTENASRWRKLAIKNLIEKECLFDEDEYLMSHCNTSRHISSYSGPVWKGFAERNTIIYYDAKNALIAQKVADTLGNNFVIARGGGLCIQPSAFPRLLMIHYRDI